MNFFGINRTVIENELDYILECIDVKGYAVIEKVLSTEECELVAEKLDKFNEQQVEKYTRERLNQLNDYGVIRDMLVEDTYFRNLVLHPTVMQVVEKVIGETAILHLQNGIVLDPDLKHHQAQFHRDFSKDFVADKVLALNAMFVIDEFSEASGGTWVVPGTHRSSKVPSDRYLEEHAIQVIAKPGSVFFFDGLLLHKAGDNRTNKPRRAVNHEYTRPFIKQQLDYAGLFKNKIDHESKFAQVIGLWSMPPKDVAEYRVDPDKRTYRKGQG
ncbi:MAG: phytanoyl-CoA dioxygenase family protein [Candidatus Obscuribacterales bacterium]|nr:phytanoyl-CoA dioxygenase family protein [Candidatus Obscuribacterales bacterium]